MNLEKKVLFLTNVEKGLESLLQELTNIRSENMLTIQSYGPVITNPYGDIMRSIIIAIFQENVEEIFVVGTKDKGQHALVDIQTELHSKKYKIQTLDYLFQTSMPEFSGGTVNEWLNGKENVSSNIEKSVNIIRDHPIVPSHVKVHGLIVHNKDRELSVVKV